MKNSKHKTDEIFNEIEKGSICFAKKEFCGIKENEKLIYMDIIGIADIGEEECTIYSFLSIEKNKRIHVSGDPSNYITIPS